MALVLGGGPGPGEALGGGQRGFAEAGREVRVVQDGGQGAGQGGRVVHRYQQGVPARGEVFAEHRQVGGDHGQPRAHRFQDGQAPAFLGGREREEVRGRVPGGEFGVGHGADQDHVVVEAEAQAGQRG